MESSVVQSVPAEIWTIIFTYAIKDEISVEHQYRFFKSMIQCVPLALSPTMATLFLNKEICFQNVRLIRYLLDCGADIMYSKPCNSLSCNNVLLHACRVSKGDTSIFSMLLAEIHKSRPHKYGRGDDNHIISQIVSKADYLGYIDIVKLMLARGASVRKVWTSTRYFELDWDKYLAACTESKTTLDERRYIDATFWPYDEYE